MSKKLLIKQSCVVAGGHIKERGDIYTTLSEQETYDLICAGRALEVSDPDADDMVIEIANEKKLAAAAKSAAFVSAVPSAGPASSKFVASGVK